MKKLFFLLIILAFGLQAQDTIRFRNGEVKAVKVQEVGLKEIKYNRFDNLTGPLYVCGKEEVNYIRYANGSVDIFTAVEPPRPETQKPEPQKEEVSNAQLETPAYVNSTPASSGPVMERISIAGKRLYYQHEALNEKHLLSLIKEHPDQQRRGLMLREYAKIPVYKNNRIIGVFLYAGGAVACVGALAVGSGPVFLVGTAATITGCIIATINKHKRSKKRVEIARIYNGDFTPGNNPR